MAGSGQKEEVEEEEKEKNMAILGDRKRISIIDRGPEFNITGSSNYSQRVETKERTKSATLKKC